jgi:hypothetical protein
MSKPSTNLRPPCSWSPRISPLMIECFLRWIHAKSAVHQRVWGFLTSKARACDCDGSHTTSPAGSVVSSSRRAVGDPPYACCGAIISEPSLWSSRLIVASSADWRVDEPRGGGGGGGGHGVLPAGTRSPWPMIPWPMLFVPGLSGTAAPNCKEEGPQTAGLGPARYIRDTTRVLLRIHFLKKDAVITS